MKYLTWREFFALDWFTITVYTKTRKKVSLVKPTPLGFRQKTNKWLIDN